MQERVDEICEVQKQKDRDDSFELYGSDTM